MCMFVVPSVLFFLLRDSAFGSSLGYAAGAIDVCKWLLRNDAVVRLVFLSRDFRLRDEEISRKRRNKKTGLPKRHTLFSDTTFVIRKNS